MRFYKKWIFFAASILICTSCVDDKNKTHAAIENGLRYLESVQAANGEFPTTFTPNYPDPVQRALQTNYESNLFTTAMLSDAIHPIKHPRVERIQKKVVTFLKSQLTNEQGLWSYFTTHNPNPDFPISVYDLDDTSFASIVLEQQGAHFPDNRKTINTLKNASGLFTTFVPQDIQANHAADGSVDCGVNADVLAYLKENDTNVCQYLNLEVASGNNCSNYGSRLVTYFLIARTYAYGVSCLKPSMPAITNYVLSQFNQKNGSVDDSPHKTAIALNTLIDSGYSGKVLNQARDYLLNTQSANNGSWPAEDFWNDWSPKGSGKASSSALTTAIALRALHKML